MEGHLARFFKPPLKKWPGVPGNPLGENRTFDNRKILTFHDPKVGIRSAIVKLLSIVLYNVASISANVRY